MMTKPSEGFKHLTDYYEGSRPKLEEFSKKTIRHWAWMGAGCFMVGLFGAISYGLLSGDPAEQNAVHVLDERVLQTAVSLRTPALNQVASDITALGSVTIVTLISLLFASGFLMTRDHIGLLQLSAAAAGGGLWMLFLKGIVERPRPDVAHRLVEVHGFSYPSGHSLTAAAFYITFAIMAARHMNRWEKKVVLYALGTMVALLVGASRIYLGVHYASDVAAGIFFGFAWAFFIAMIVSIIGRKSIKEKAHDAHAAGLPAVSTPVSGPAGADAREARSDSALPA